MTSKDENRKTVLARFNKLFGERKVHTNTPDVPTAPALAPMKIKPIKTIIPTTERKTMTEITEEIYRAYGKHPTATERINMIKATLPPNVGVLEYYRQHGRLKYYGCYLMFWDCMNENSEYKRSVRHSELFNADTMSADAREVFKDLPQNVQADYINLWPEYLHVVNCGVQCEYYRFTEILRETAQACEIAEHDLERVRNVDYLSNLLYFAFVL